MKHYKLIHRHHHRHRLPHRHCVTHPRTRHRCEELTTYETREVVAVPNSRSMGGV
jgi:hypothetical protein